MHIENTLMVAVDLQERIMPSIANNEEIARKTEILMRGCTLLNIPLLVTQQYTKGLGDTLANLKNAIPDFAHIEKMTFSCFRDDGFRKKLEGFSVKNILVAGVEAHICVQQTVLDLLESGYNVFVSVDCIGSRYEKDLRYSEKRMQQAGAVLTTVESVLFGFLDRADHPKRKEISSLVK